MSTLHLAIVCPTLIVLALIVVFPRVATAAGATDDAREDVLEAGREVVQHTFDGKSIHGTVVADRPHELELAGAALLAGGTEQPIGGAVRIPAANRSFIQVL